MDLLDIAITKQLVGGGGGSGTDNYNDLSNLPKINDVTLSGNKSSSTLGLQSEITSENKLDSDLIDDTNQDNKFVTSSEKNTWNGKQNAIDADHKLNADYVDDSTSTNKFVTASDKEAWNAKQSAIDSDHKLSSSLVSFSAAEAAALASGIDSNKVEQIGTNQTNILYTLEVGAKNLFRWDKWVNDCTVVGGTKTISSGKMTLTSSSTNCYTEYEGSAYPDVEIAVKENEHYVITWENTRISGSARGTVYVVFVGSTGAATASASAEVKKIEFTTPAGTTGLRVYIKQTTDALIESYSDFMICSKAVWDTLGHDYQPPSVSNYELTKLESEDRAMLVEQVDASAKNEFILGDFVVSSGGTTATISGNAVTVAGASSWSKAWRTFRVQKNTTYVLSFRVTNVATVASPYYRVSLGNNYHSGGSYYGIISCNTTGNYYLEFTPPTDTDIYLVINPNYTPTAASDMPSITVDNIMVCTEAAFRVSPTYAPYHKSIDQLEAEDRKNILYSLRTGVKNLFNPEASGNWQYGLSSYSADAKTGTMSMATTASDWARTSVPITLPAGEYKFCGNVTALVGSAVITGNTSSSGQETAIFNNIELSTTGTFEISFTLNTETPFWIAVYANFSSSIVSNSVTITGMMICTKAAWDQEPNVYRPFARPNYDLTVLEAEDRAALAEQVDEGAKNALYLDIDKIKSIHTAGTWTGNTYVNAGITITIKDDGTIELYGTATSTLNFVIFADESGTAKYAGMELSGCPTGGSDSTYLLYAMSSDYASQGSDYGNGVVISNNPITRVRIQVKKNVDMGTEQSPTIFKPMICTVADWKISKNHAPFALPNTDLTRLVTTKAPALSTSTAIDSGSLDDVAENTFAVYASTVTNVPTSNDYYVETIVYDASNALQKAYNYTDGTSYVRVKNAATWGNWKQITNA